jgi:hypothetical protein
MNVYFSISDILLLHQAGASALSCKAGVFSLKDMVASWVNEFAAQTRSLKKGSGGLGRHRLSLTKE